MTPSYPWFERLDQLRRAQGNILDHLGLGPQESPFRIIFERPGLRLRQYGKGPGKRPPLLLVPAPIKQAYIWDLSPERSVVRRALAQQLGVYLVEWTEPEHGTPGPGLADYAGAMLDDCIAFLRAHSGAAKVFLAGHSLGGVFAALHSAYRPSQVAGLVLVDAPLHFAGAAAGYRHGIELHPAARVPGSLLGKVSAQTRPGAFCTSRYVDWLASMGSRERSVTHWRVERWTLDERAMSRQLFNDVVEQLYRGNRFMRGDFAIRGAALHPQQVTAPLLSVYHTAGGVVPVDAVVAFHRAAGSRAKELLPYPGDIGVALQHVGPLVGDRAHRLIWPRVLAWLERIASESAEESGLPLTQD